MYACDKIHTIASNKYNINEDDDLTKLHVPNQAHSLPLI